MQVRFYHCADIFAFFSVPIQDLFWKGLRKYWQVNLAIAFKSINPIQDGHFWDCSRMGGQKDHPPP